MLKLINIVKDYQVGDQTVPALKGVDLSFRKSEFVSILGPSGCGKTTLLNIIGGLDRYTSGDLIINGKSTKQYNDKDWDTYRNHTIGFVFQSYNLIPHQTVLSNVELALVFSGTNKEERKNLAIEALKKVGLGDQLNKLPNQLSGGQMQRVAIARAIVNNPDIILADEPTGALDTKTSVQVMDLLKEIAKEKLVIMVTHNPELANAYSTRIIRLHDGLVEEDNMPYDTEGEKQAVAQENNKQETKDKKAKKPSMSLLTALSLSFKNLGTKKARTILTSFAGSIGIIGIALILSLSAGFNAYIATVQRDTLSNYPVTITSSKMDAQGYMASFMAGSTQNNGSEKYPTDNVVISNDTIANMMQSMSSSYGVNDLKSFKDYIEESKKFEDPEKILSVKYSYNFGMHLFTEEKTGYRLVNKVPPVKTFFPDNVSIPENGTIYNFLENFANLIGSSGSWGEMIGNNELIKSQYDLLSGTQWPDLTKPDENGYWPITLVVDSYNSIPDYALYMLGIFDDEYVSYLFAQMITDILSKQLPADKAQEFKDAFEEKYGNYVVGSKKFSFEELMNKEFSLLLNGDLFAETDKGPTANLKIFENMIGDADYVNQLVKNSSIKLKVKAVIRLKEGTANGALSKYVYYPEQLTQAMLKRTQELPVVKAQQNCIDMAEANGETSIWDVVQGKGVDDLTETKALIGMVDSETPTSISIYPTSFENKDFIISVIDEYNAAQESEDAGIQYSDYIGMMMSSITVIINSITYVLIAFVSISLVVSSIMIGVITYISVLERTKEIGILRAIGASKGDIARVFNAETMIIGFISGALGIGITLLLNIPINLIITALTGIPSVAVLPWIGGISLVIISIVLTFISGLIPSGIASRKEPVIALRTE